MQYQAQEQEYFESEFGDDSLAEKRKRLAGAPQHQSAPTSAQQTGTNRYDVQVIAWQFLGTIGILLTLAAFILAIVFSSPFVLVVPLIYMVAVISLMRYS